MKLLEICENPKYDIEQTEFAKAVRSKIFGIYGEKPKAHIITFGCQRLGKNKGYALTDGIYYVR